MKIPTILLGKTVQKLSRLKGNGGSALPGLIIEKTDKNFLRDILSKLPYGVVVVSGTNGKTTTTKIITELLQSQNLKVFTNKTGSNFVRGVISAVIKNIKFTGKFDYDIAVLELDEAHAVKFAEVVPIDYALLLNVQRDQLDRFGEIDYVAKCLQKVASKAKKAVVLNREDPQIEEMKTRKAIYFGLSNALVKKFPSDDNIIVHSDKKASSKPAEVILKAIDGNRATFDIAGEKYATTLELKGIYNAYNAAGALAIVKTILPSSDTKELIHSLANIKSAFGRGETFVVNGAKVELLLVKNPSAFELSLASFADDKHDFMIAINDEVADGRDVSWLWNVDFRHLKNVKITAGTRAADMALRLKYDDVLVEDCVENLRTALRKFTKANKKPKRIFATYTAMLELRKIINGKSLSWN